MKIEPEYFGLQHVRGEHYWSEDHYGDILLYVTDRDGANRGNRLPVGEYRMHCWVSDTDGNGYYATVYFDQDGDSIFEQGF